jgi:hypothetical protein
MAKHNIYFEVPTCELGKTDIFFHIQKDEEKFGTITISKGNLQWYPKNSKKPYTMSWSAFDKIIREYHGE